MPSVADWKWDGENPEFTPWYKNARLFRQQADEEWASVIEKVKSAVIENKNTASIDPNKINIALQFHQSGNFEEAKVLYNEILCVESNNPNALYLLGMLSYQEKNLYEAIEYLDRAAMIFPSADIYKLLGDIYYDLDEIPYAAQNYQKALDLKPEFPEIYYNLGVILSKNNDIDGAVSCYQTAISQKSDYAEAYFNLADCLRQTKENDIAVVCYQKVIELQPNNVEAYLNLGNIFKNQKKYDEAASYYEKAILINPNKADSYYNMGLVAYLQEDIDKSIELYQRAISLNPAFIEAYFNLGLMYYYKCEFEKALDSYKKVLALNSQNQSPDIYINLGNLYKQLKQMEKAKEYYNKALELDPGNINVFFNLGLTNILTKNFDEGWKYFEYRFIGNENFYPKVVYSGLPKWDGRDLSGKTIYVHFEAGFGDTIQFVRYIPQLKDMGAKVLLKVQPELESLFKNNNLNAEIIPSYIPDSSLKLDYFTTLMSFPYLFNAKENNIPLKFGYIKACEEKTAQFKKEYFNNNKLKVGLAWKRKVINMSDNNNSISHIKAFLPLLQDDRVQFYSLQKGNGVEQLNELSKDINVINLDEALKDFSDTAAVIENLDLVISIDNVLIHLAGAMNKPAWALLPYVPNWRWFLDSDTSIWYDSIKLFRQSSFGDWDTVVKNISVNLQDIS